MRRDLPLALAAAFVLLAAVGILRVYATGPSVALYDAAGGQQIAVGGEACGIQAKGEGFTPGDAILSAIRDPSGQPSSSFRDIADADGVFRGKPYYDLLGSLTFTWYVDRTDENVGGSIAFVNVCKGSPLPVPTPRATVAPGLTLPPTDTEE